MLDWLKVSSARFPLMAQVARIVYAAGADGSGCAAVVRLRCEHREPRSAHTGVRWLGVCPWRPGCLDALHGSADPGGADGSGCAAAVLLRLSHQHRRGLFR